MTEEKRIEAKKLHRAEQISAIIVRCQALRLELGEGEIELKKYLTEVSDTLSKALSQSLS